MVDYIYVFILNFKGYLKRKIWSIKNYIRGRVKYVKAGILNFSKIVCVNG